MHSDQIQSILAWAQRTRRRWVLLALLGAMPAFIGCYGRFPLTRMIYRLNGEITNDKWVHSIVFWVFIIIPVYGVASCVDAVVLNLIQFWTGDTVDLGQGIDAQGNRVAFVPSADGSRATLTVSRDGRTLYEGQFVRDGEKQWAILGRDGAREGVVAQTPEGAIEIRDTAGRVLRTIPAAAVQLARERAGVREHAEAEHVF